MVIKCQGDWAMGREIGVMPAPMGPAPLGVWWCVEYGGT